MFIGKLNMKTYQYTMKTYILFKHVLLSMTDKECLFDREPFQASYNGFIFKRK